MTELPNMSFLKDGLVPTVAVDDMKRVFAMQQEVVAKRPSGGVAIGASVYEQECTSGSDAQTVWYRLSWLFALQHWNDAGQINFPWMRDGKPDEAVLKALATIPMSGMTPKVMNEGLPFDVEELIRMVQKESEI